jgi:stage III sporulation protein AB
MLLILSAGLGLSSSACRELRERTEALGQIARMLHLIREEIRVGQAPLGEAFGRAGAKLPGVYGEFLSLLARRMEENQGISFAELYESSARELFGELPLDTKEREALFTLGRELGYLDLEVQLCALKRQEEIFREFQDSLKADLPRRQKLYRSLGISGALFLVVLLW